MMLRAESQKTVQSCTTKVLLPARSSHFSSIILQTAIPEAAMCKGKRRVTYIDCREKHSVIVIDEPCHAERSRLEREHISDTECIGLRRYFTRLLKKAFDLPGDCDVVPVNCPGSNTQCPECLAQAADRTAPYPSRPRVAPYAPNLLKELPPLPLFELPRPLLRTRTAKELPPLPQTQTQTQGKDKELLEDFLKRAPKAPRAPGSTMRRGNRPSPPNSRRWQAS